MTDAEMKETCTYTARSVEDPDQVVTFTLTDGHMTLNLTGLVEQLTDVATADEKAGAAKEGLGKQVGPATMKGIESISGPVHVQDVSAQMKDGRLTVTTWQRAAGLRLVPIAIKMGRVDNEEGAAAFIDELDERQAEAEHAGKFYGPLDYWFGWVALFMVLAILLRWPGEEE